MIFQFAPVIVKIHRERDDHKFKPQFVNIRSMEIIDVKQ